MTRNVTVLAVLVTLALAGCGGAHPGVATAGPGRPAASALPSPAADLDQREQQFQQCMLDNGVDVRPAQDKSHVTPGDPKKFEAAIEVCRVYLAGPEDVPPMAPADIEKMRQFSQCVRDHGVPDWPDPDPRTGQINFVDDAAATAVKKNPKLTDAMKACEQLAPSTGTGTAGG